MKLGLQSGCSEALSGSQIEMHDVESLGRIIENVYVFYRVSPRHKLKIIKVISFSHP